MADPRGPGRLLGLATSDGMALRGAQAELRDLMGDWGVADIVAAMHDIVLDYIDTGTPDMDEENIRSREERVDLLRSAYEKLNALELYDG